MPFLTDTTTLQCQPSHNGMAESLCLKASKTTACARQVTGFAAQGFLSAAIITLNILVLLLILANVRYKVAGRSSGAPYACILGLSRSSHHCECCVMSAFVSLRLPYVHKHKDNAEHDIAQRSD
jgi:formate hydrogenlyase subunit 4